MDRGAVNLQAEYPVSSVAREQVRYLNVMGAGCASCVTKIESALRQVPGVEAAEMNFAQRIVSVTGDVRADALVHAIRDAGYDAESIATDDTSGLDEKEQSDRAHYNRLLRHAWLSLGVGVPMMLYGVLGGDMGVHSRNQQMGWLAVGLLTLGVMAFPGRHFYLGAWKAFRHRSANMDTLIALGTGTAWLYSMVVVLGPDMVPAAARHVYFEATTMIIGLVCLGLALEARARGRTSQAIRRLVGLQPRTARVIRDGIETDIPIVQVRPDDLVRIRPGERIPVDGVVREGRGAVDESMLTGEPMPAEKAAGDPLAAGTINSTGTLILRATRVGRQTTLARIIESVRRAQNSKPPIGRMADRISAWFVPVVMIIAVLAALAWLNFGPVPALALAMVSATTVLIIACPCALGLATPMSVMVGVGKAAEHGILIRNGEALQTASRISTMILDKTGTITRGKPEVTDVVAAEGATGEQVLALAAGLEQGSEHPLAAAIADYAASRGIRGTEIRDFNAVPGKGLEGVSADGTRLLFGNDRLLEDRGVSAGELAHVGRALAGEAKTAVFLAAGDAVLGVIAVADRLREDSADAVRRLGDAGIRVIMMTGDNMQTAHAVAAAVGIDDCFAGVLPEDKEAKVRELQDRGEVVGMTGDGINDAPALARADVGFAIGTGTDIAIESADITLIHGSLHGLADATAISRATLRNIRQNLFGAFVYNTAGIPIAAGVLYPLFGILLSPVIAGAAMALSSFTVVSNAGRLRLYRPRSA